MKDIYIAYGNDTIWFSDKRFKHRGHKPTPASERRLARALQKMFYEGKLAVRPGDFELSAIFAVK